VILADTSVWIDHLRAGDTTLARLLEHGSVLEHPWVAGELALGRLSRRAEILRLLHGLPQAEIATASGLEDFNDAHALHGVGIGYVDAQLLAAARLAPDARLWTREARLAAVATRLGVGHDPGAIGR
jgi:hypothetical protein